jgi:hypothetical protein
MIVPLLEMYVNRCTGMINMKRYLLISCFAALVVFLKAEGLSNRSDSTDIFINGWEYRLVPARNSHPFVFSKVWNFDEINSELGTRKDFLMNYDIYQDVLVIQTFINGSPAQIVLNPANIISFSIEGRNFINPHKVPQLARTPLNGYYELVYKGDLIFLAKHSSKITEEGSINGRAYEAEVDYYVFWKDRVFSFRNKRSFLKIFPAYKKEISRYMRDQNILMNAASLQALKEMIKYVDVLVTD